MASVLGLLGFVSLSAPTHSMKMGVGALSLLAPLLLASARAASQHVGLPAPDALSAFALPAKTAAQAANRRRSAHPPLAISAAGETALLEGGVNAGGRGSRADKHVVALAGAGLVVFHANGTTAGFASAAVEKQHAYGAAAAFLLTVARAAAADLSLSGSTLLRLPREPKGDIVGSLHAKRLSWLATLAASAHAGSIDNVRDVSEWTAGWRAAGLPSAGAAFGALWGAENKEPTCTALPRGTPLAKAVAAVVLGDAIAAREDVAAPLLSAAPVGGDALNCIPAELEAALRTAVRRAVARPDDVPWLARVFPPPPAGDAVVTCAYLLNNAGGLALSLAAALSAAGFPADEFATLLERGAAVEPAAAVTALVTLSSSGVVPRERQAARAAMQSANAAMFTGDVESISAVLAPFESLGAKLARALGCLARLGLEGAPASTTAANATPPHHSKTP